MGLVCMISPPMKTASIFFSLALMFVMGLRAQVIAFDPPGAWTPHQVENLTFAIPPDWEVNEEAQIGVSFFIFCPMSERLDGFAENLNLAKENLKGRDLDLDQYLALSMTTMERVIGDFKMQSQEPFELNGSPGYVMVSSGVQGNDLALTFKTWMMIVEEVAYVITFVSKPDEFDRMVPLADQIVGTFDILSDIPAFEQGPNSPVREELEAGWERVSYDGYALDVPTDWELSPKVMPGISLGIYSPTEEGDPARENLTIVKQNMQGSGVSLTDYANQTKKQVELIISDMELLEERTTEQGDFQVYILRYSGKMGEMGLLFTQHVLWNEGMVYVLTFTESTDKEGTSDFKEAKARFFSSFTVSE